MLDQRNIKPTFDQGIVVLQCKSFACKSQLISHIEHDLGVFVHVLVVLG